MIINCDQGITMEIMSSEDHKARLNAEYRKACIRIKKLRKCLNDLRYGKLGHISDNECQSSVSQRFAAMVTHRTSVWE